MNTYTPLKVSAPVRRRPEPSVDKSRGEVKGRTRSQVVDSPSLKAVHLETWSVLKGAVDDLCANDFGRPWPSPRSAAIARALATHDPDLCLQAAREAREIVQSQDRAPNITSLFEKKLQELVEVRETVRRELAAAGGESR